MIDDKKFRKILDDIMYKNDGVLKALADDDGAKKIIQRRDRCPKCGSRDYPCKCWDDDSSE
jgi:hypothetical protein